MEKDVIDVQHVTEGLKEGILLAECPGVTGVKEHPRLDSSESSTLASHEGHILLQNLHFQKLSNSNFM
jgi:hypothetical protein